ncbi:MAG TPA: DUF3662 and FHA domain-containing protein [Acidimicrobiia bacterium]|nr:DUF3662 and FHA domain-containing protein [Acidimicrobiia bacterium]
MKLVRDFERRLEQFVGGMTGLVFRGKLHPVELAARLVREADLSIEEGRAGPTAANVYSLKLNPRDLDTNVPSDLVLELEDVLETTAADRGWRLDGPVQVSLEPAEGVSPGTADCRVGRSPGTRQPWAFLTTGRGTRHEVRHNRCVIGRAETSDITIGDPGVSRTQALLWREAGEVWVVDLGSANGTRVNGASAHAPRLLTTGSVVTFGPLPFTFRLV